MNKKGNAIVESALIFPLVILTVMALIYMMVYFYGQLSDKVDMHIALRAEGGELCENMYYKDIEDNGFVIYKEAQQIYSSGNSYMQRKGLLDAREKTFTARKYLIDETRYVRLLDVLGDGFSEDVE